MPDKKGDFKDYLLNSRQITGPPQPAPPVHISLKLIATGKVYEGLGVM